MEKRIKVNHNCSTFQRVIDVIQEVGFTYDHTGVPFTYEIYVGHIIRVEFILWKKPNT